MADAAMDDFAIVTEPGTVRLERLLPGPIERVWAYLTDPGKRGTWLAAGPMEQRVGGAVELRFRHADLSSFVAPTPARHKAMENGHISRGEVTCWEPPNRLAFTWNGPSEVTFELVAQGDDVLLVVTQRRLPDSAEMISVASGWHAHLRFLADRLGGVEPPAFWPVHDEATDEYERRFSQTADRSPPSAR